jgi:hypothetical protein
MTFPNICSGSFRCQLFSKRTRFETVSYVIVAPTTYPVALDFHEVNEAKAQNIILDGVKDHLIPHFAEKKIANKFVWGGHWYPMSRNEDVDHSSTTTTTFHPKLFYSCTLQPKTVSFSSQEVLYMFCLVCGCNIMLTLLGT